MEVNKVIQGDCLIKLKELEDNSIDSIVTDPPYELGFMGKSWDNTGIANNKDMWAECLRVLKPGGHLLSFGGTRTYHRMASAIEDAGFEVRDMIEWVYGCLSEDTEVLTEKGFKHFHKITQDDIIRIYDTQNDIYKWEKPQRWSQYAVEQDTAYRIKSDTTDQIVSRNHNCLVEREGKLVFIQAEELSDMETVPYLSEDIFNLQEICGELLFKKLLWKSKDLVKKLFSKWTWKEVSEKRNERCEKSSLEGRINLSQEKRKVCRPINKICKMSKRLFRYGSERWVCNGTQIKSSNGNKKTIKKNRVCSSYKSQRNRQQIGKSDAIQDKSRPQEIRVGTGYKTTLATITPIEYTGMIFCPTVSTGVFVARRNGKIFITGNSGFPKSLNIGKAVDKLQGNEREYLGEVDKLQSYGYEGNNCFGGDIDRHGKMSVTKGTSEWEGWGTALKPSHEPICMARKPLAEKTVAENCLKYGTGGINIDESRVESSQEDKDMLDAKSSKNPTGVKSAFGGGIASKAHEQGRFPANLIHDNSEEVRECFPESKSGAMNGIYKNTMMKGQPGVRDGKEIYLHQEASSGNASRFFKSIEQVVDLNDFSMYNRSIIINIKKLCGQHLTKKKTGIILDGVIQEVEKFIQDAELLISGNSTMEKFLTDIAFTIKTLIAQMTELKTLNVLPNWLITKFTENYEQTIKLLKELNTEDVRSAKSIFLLQTFINEVLESIRDIAENVVKKDSNNGEKVSDSFFKSIIYQAKASKSERNRGCEGLENEKFTAGNYSQSAVCKTCDKTLNGTNDHSKCSGEVYYREMKSKKTANNHPTVKPIALMEYLIKMVTPKGGIVLDPFAGSGSTLVAAKQNGFNYIGIELTPEYIPIIEARLNAVRQGILI